MRTSIRMFGNISNIYMATAQGQICLILRIIKLFSFNASLNYLSNANRQNISPKEIA